MKKLSFAFFILLFNFYISSSIAYAQAIPIPPSITSYIPATATAGDILYFDGTSWVSLAKSASSTRSLCNTGSSNIPAWCQVSLSTGITGNLPLASVTSGATTLDTSYFPSSPKITAGSGTGYTVNNVGEVRKLIYKATITYTNCIAAAVTCDVTIATLPAKTNVTRIIADVTQAFVCASTCTTATLSATVGKTAGGNEYLTSFDIDAAVARFGLLATDLGTSIVALVNGDTPSWTATTTLQARITSALGNLGNGSASNLNAGSITYYVLTEVMP